MVNKPFLLLGLAAECRSRRRRRWCDKQCGRPSDVYDTDQRTKLTALEMTFTQKTNKSLFEPPFRALRGNVRIPSMARWKLYIRRNWTSRYLLRFRRYKRKSVEVGVFRRGWVILSADFRGKGASSTNHCWCQSSGVIALSCGIKISAVHHLDLSQSTRDRQTGRRTDGQNYDSQDRSRICSRGKNWRIEFKLGTITFVASRAIWRAKCTVVNLGRRCTLALLLSDFHRHSFAVSAPDVWNNIPAAVRDFVSLDTFKTAF